MLQGKNILLIISGGIAAFKALELIRLLRKNNARVRCILTKGGEQFITPLSVASLSEEKVYTDLWSLTDETEMGHIRLSRESDLILIAPASADLLAKMAHGMANDLASTTLLAADKPVLAAPAMNQMMWANAATQANIETLKKRGVSIIGPSAGEMACGETGLGRMSEPEEILNTVKEFFFDLPLKGLKAIVTSGPTYEPLDPVRFLGNRSSGKQGHALARALRDAGADVTLITGPVALPEPTGIRTIHIETAQQMLEASEKALPADITICAAAVSDWRPTTTQKTKIKKRSNQTAEAVELIENPDILKTISTHKTRPKLVIGFAAETENLAQNAQEKLKRKQCDWIIANEVGDGKAFGEDHNTIWFCTKDGLEEWPSQSKDEIAHAIVKRMAKTFSA